MDISNPLNFLFVADQRDNFIDVIDVGKGEKVFRIEVPNRVDALYVTPYSSLLYFSNIEESLLSVYDLKKRNLLEVIQLPIVPRHIVPNPTDTRIAISDSQGGGMMLLSTIDREVVHLDADFPATVDMLFDPSGYGLYYSNNETGAIGLVNLESYESGEIPLVDSGRTELTAPSRSLDGRYIYVSDLSSGTVYGINAFSGVVFKTFEVGQYPSRPYTTPEGLFLYMIDTDSGRIVSVEQNHFGTHHDTTIGEGIDLITVGRFDRLNLFLSTINNRYYIFDNLRKETIAEDEFVGIPHGAQGSVDGRRAFVVFRDLAQIAAVDLEKNEVRYISATQNGVGAYVLGGSNNVCH